MYRVVVTYKKFAEWGNVLAFDEFITRHARPKMTSIDFAPSGTTYTPNERRLVFQFKTKEGAENAKKRIKATGRLLRVHVSED